MPECAVTHELDGLRFDAALARLFPESSRAAWHQRIQAGLVRLNDNSAKPGRTVHAGDRVSVALCEASSDSPHVRAENIPLEVLYEDPALAVINKPPGLVIHPAAGHASGTLVNALLHRYPELDAMPDAERPGIVHRLDKDTSGALIIARTEHAARELARQFKDRETRKTYLAITCGIPEPPSGRIETLIGRSQHDRKKMSVLPARGREAVSEYTVEKAFSTTALVRVRILTGRTHQIRVHLTHIGCPILGDRLYGGRREAALRNNLSATVPRQMLHAHIIEFIHPDTQSTIRVAAPVPDDFQQLVDFFL